ncbi:tumor necrosis factor ligand superfamily member 10 isoform 2, partial [Daubentonia madagascariensis]
APRMKKLWARK